MPPRRKIARLNAEDMIMILQQYHDGFIVQQDIQVLLRPHKAGLLQCKPRSLTILATCNVHVHSNKWTNSDIDQKWNCSLFYRTNSDIDHKWHCSLCYRGILVLEKDVQKLLKISMPQPAVSFSNFTSAIEMRKYPKGTVCHYRILLLL